MILVNFRSIQEKTPSHSFTNEKSFPPGDSILAQIMTTKEVSKDLKLHGITICKFAAQGKIPAIRIGKVWRFNKEVIDKWIRTGQNETKADGRSKSKGGKEESGKKKPRK